jgi:hypothetical protein
VYTRDRAADQIASLKRKFSASEETSANLRRLYELVRDRPHYEAMAIVGNIRRGDDPNDIVRRVEHGDMLVQMRLVPETRYRYEFPFRKEMPAFLVRSGSRYLRSSLLEPPFPEPRSASDISSAVPQTAAMMPKIADHHTKPYGAVTLVEPLLNIIHY